MQSTDENKTELERALAVFPDLAGMHMGEALPIAVYRLLQRIEELERRLVSLELWARPF